MHKQPVLLRRTTSNIVGSSDTSGTSTSTTTTDAIGSGGQFDPDNAIPIEDEHSGWRDNSHKRKLSGIPLDAEAIIKRASVQTSLEQITDEDEEQGGILLNRSFSEPDLRLRGDSWQMEEDDPTEESQGGSTSMPEFSELFPDGNGWTIKSLLTSRGVASVALVVMAIAFVAVHPHGPAASAEQTAGGNGQSSNNVDSITPQSPNPNSKEITIGEYHQEVVGTPVEHHVNEYNKIQFYDSPDKMKPIFSKGPILQNSEMGGLHLFENVCLTNNVDALRYRPDPETSLRGLIYFTDEESVVNNPKRCVPCSNHEPMEDWGDDNVDEKVVGHKCGMDGLHAMFASSVGDWTDCIMQEENTALMEKWGQTQSPVNVSTIHFFQEPTFLLQFNALDMEKSLFDMLMTYLPHWDHFLGANDDEDDEDEEDGGFPFSSVISHSLQGCLSHSHNWFCEVLHGMHAFGTAKEIPWEGDDNTLYCYRELYYNQVGYQRNLDHEGLVTRENFGEFREILFRKFGLPRRRTVEDRLAELEFEKSQHQQGKDGGGGKNGNNANNDDDGENDTKIIFYDNKLSEQTVWNEMESLISKARELEKYQNIKFVTVNQDFAKLTVAQQARKFNEADAIIMAHGQHMANAIFAVDGTSFVEVGCKVTSLIGNPKFMELMDGKYRAVERCGNNKDDGEGKGGHGACVVCKGDGDDVNFTMTPAAFEQLIDDVVASLAR
eukprot:CAMPEP_0172301998 /NCGR_PEP_ID=MMETSP1058-20130122/3776_1 /TAXON_ID=83371 /ORGANISM="Detonula confervacea, Strain CCMP 353" /LENGTH=718 /DNA_ID=CAMNT_0013012323 /DNA_START=210 /DNA_END=2366 /DNA_ORIENTATION=+